MMNFFSSAAPTEAELEREAAVKGQITDNLKQALKALQQTHINSDDAIQSEDTANAVCSVLEAVFLHGLKAPVTKKLYYVTGRPEDVTLMNFWGLLRRMTHKNTLSQLNRLGQITTEVGMCRAWLRLALNDGVLESYLDAILADTKTLRYFYKKTAYLRDEEHPGILKTYIQGLSHFYFQLSYNSSVLNIWSHTPLLLAGLVAPPSEPRAVVAPITGIDALLVSEEPSSLRAQEAVSPASSKTRKRKVREDTGQRSGTRTVNSFGYAHLGVSGQPHPATPPNTPHDPSQLTATDIEIIRNITAKVTAGSDDNSSTNASQISHPDPVDARQLEPPTLVFRSSERSRAGGSDQESPQPKMPLRDRTDRSSPKLRTENTPSQTQSGVLNVSAHVKKTSPVHENKTQTVPRLNGNTDVVTENTALQDRGLTHNNAAESSLTNNASSSKDISSEPHGDLPNRTCDDESSNVGLSLSDNDFKSDVPVTSTAGQIEVTDDMNVYTASTSHNTIRFEDSVDRDLDQFRAPRLSRRDMSRRATSPDITDTLTSLEDSGSSSTRLTKSSSFPKLTVGKSPPLEPEMSKAMATPDTVEVAKEALFGISESPTEHSSALMDEAEADIYPTGNSLSGREGWSSDFETSHQSDWGDSNGFLISDNHFVTSINESFVNMLDNYGSAVGRLEAPTMSEVIQGLPNSEILSEQQTRRPATDSSSSPAVSRVQRERSVEEEMMREYEVLPDIREQRAYLSEPRFQPMLDILGTLCTEKGLDMQNYQCKGCSRPVGMFYGKARVCGYDSCYYCYECHENDEAYIPARIVFNWDFRKQKVCRQNLKFLQQSEEDPLLNIEQLNPKLYKHVEEMGEIKNLRIQLRFLKAYLFTCKQSIADDLRKQVWPREYYYDDIDVYSVSDLLQVATGQLAQTIGKIVKFAHKHVYDCGLCSQKGFICEICNSPKVIYPFEMETTCQCQSCKALYHIGCKRKLSKCPKCERRRERLLRLGTISVSTPDCVHDYAVSPDN